MDTQGNRVSHTYTMTIDADAASIFPLLCPVREYDWIDVWTCDLVYSESGIAELGCVFLTDLPGRGAETWVVTRFEPPSAIEFSRTAGVTRACFLQVTLEPDAGGGTTLEWKYTHTGIDTAGREWVSEYPTARFETEMEGMAERLRHYLRTGEMLRSDNANH